MRDNARKTLRLALLFALIVSCGPTGALVPHDGLAHHRAVSDWAAQYGVPEPQYMASCPSSLPIPGPLYLDALEGVVCLATDSGGSWVYTYPRNQQSMAAEVMLAHEIGHHIIATMDGEQSELAADCIAGAYYGEAHTRLQAWWAGWMVPYRAASEAGAGLSLGARRRAWTRGVRGGIQECLEETQTP